MNKGGDNMAKIVGKNSALEEEFTHCRNLSQLGLGVSVAAWVIFALNIGLEFMPFEAAVILLLFIAGGSFVRQHYGDKASMLAAGLTGEASTAGIISSLPETYCGFQNIRVTYEGKTSELDMVVSGPTGVFIIETKNMNGTIMGAYDAPYWTQHKVGQKGTPYSKAFYSPVKQVQTHVYRLANFLRNAKINTYVETMVYFSNPNSMVQVTGGPTKTPVFSTLGNGAEAIRNHILCGRQHLSGEELLKLNTLLNGLAS